MTKRTLRLYTTVHATTHLYGQAARARLDQAASRARSDAGVSTLEIVVWAVGLLLAATAAVLVVRTAITSRTSQIN